MTKSSFLLRAAAPGGAALVLGTGNKDARAGEFFHRERHYWLWRHRRRVRRRHRLLHFLFGR